MDKKKFGNVFSPQDKILWRKINRNGAFKLRKKALRKSIENDFDLKNMEVVVEEEQGASNVFEHDEINVCQNYLCEDDLCEDDLNAQVECDDYVCEDDSCENDLYVSDECADYVNKQNAIEFRNELRDWAVDNQVNHSAVNALLKILKNHIPENALPKDARTLLQTPRNVQIESIENGQYWHYGLQTALLNALSGREQINTLLSLNVNIDGVPVFKSSLEQFWPILVNITELSDISPQVVGIFCGKSNDSSFLLRIYSIFFSLHPNFL